MGSGESIAGVLLAAGASRRLGRNKLVLEVEGEPLVARTARHALAAGLSPLVVVVGFEAERIRSALARLHCAIVPNPDFTRGMGSSLAVGVRALPAEVSAAVVLLADMPQVGPGSIRAIVERRRSSGAPVVAARYGGVPAPPTLFDASLFGLLAEVDGDGGARAVVEAVGARVVHVDLPGSRLLDVDTDADLARMSSGSGSPA